MKRTNDKKKLIVSFIILVTFVVGIFASFFLLNSNQDLRQQADSGAYSTGSGDDPTVASSVDEPATGEFGWNYTTGQAATIDDWSNTDVEIAGTYVQCNGGECKRYVVNIQATHDALEAYSEDRKKENGSCSQNLGGFCVAWEEDKPSSIERVAETGTEEEKNKTEESNEGSRCTQSASCTGGTVCAYSPYGAFCVKQDDAGAAEILEETETLGEKAPTNSLGYSSSMECVTRCGTTCGGPGGKYCPIPESETKKSPISYPGNPGNVPTSEEEPCVGSWCGQELKVTEEEKIVIEEKRAIRDSKTDPQAALMNFLETGDINHLKENAAFGASLAEITSGGTSDDPEVLLKRMLGEENGAEVYQTYALPQILGNAINNFSQNPNELENLCTKTLGSSCNLSSSNAAEKLGKVFAEAYGSNPDFNTSEVAVITANQLFVEAKEEKRESALDNLGAMIAYSSANNNGALFTQSGRDNLSQSMDAYEQSREDLKIAIETSHIFNSQDTFEYASTASVREDLSDFTYGTALGNAFMYDNVFDREYDLEEDLGLTGVDAASMTWNQVITQGFNVQNTTENIATNYAIARQQDYSGPANTSVADVSFQAAQNLGGDFEEALGMDYQAATDGHYALQNLNNASATIADWTTTAGTFLVTDTTDLTIRELSDIAVAAGDEAGDLVRQEKTEELAERHNEKVEETGGQKVKVAEFIEFQTDEEIVRSKKELDWEVAEKVVAPVAAVVVLPVAVAAGAGMGIIAGASSSVFSFYQGAGMKADALELNRVEISENVNRNRKNIAALDLMEASLLSGEEIKYEEALGTIEDQVDMLEKQGNMMLASSAVASLTSGAGIINGFSQTGQAAMASGQAVSKVSQLALNSSRVSQVMSAGGRIGGLGLSGINTLSSGQQTYESFKSLKTFNTTGVATIGGVVYDKSQMSQSEIRSLNSDLGWQTGMSGLSTFAAGSGVIGNAGGMINGFNSGFDTALTKTDYVLDMMNIPAGLAIDAQNVSQSCFNSSYPSDEKACGDAWVGLALSFTQDLASKHSSTQAYLAHKNSGADYVQKISLVDKQLTELLDNPKRTLGDNLEITDLRSHREDMVVKALVMNPSLEIPEVVRSKTSVAVVDISKLRAQAEADNNKLLEVALEVESRDSNLANKLIDQADARLKNQKEIIKLSEEISEIDKQVNQESLDTPKTEIDELAIQRKVLLDRLDSAVSNPDFKSSNLDPSNKLLLAAAEKNETFKIYEELRAAQDQVSAAAEKQNIPPPKRTTERIAEFVKDPVNITKAGVGGVVDRVKNFSIGGFIENSKTNLASNLRDRKTKTVKSKLTDTKNSFDQLVKSQEEVKKSNSEIKRLQQELLDINELAKIQDLDVDQDFRRSEINGDITEIKKVIKIFESDVIDLESQLSKSILAEGVGQKLAQAQEDDDLKNVLKVVRVEEITKLTNGKNKSGLSDPQIDLLKEMTVIKEQIIKTTSAEELIKQRDLYNEKLTELNQDILGKNPKLENYQKLSTAQEFLKNIDLLNSVDSALAKGKTDSIADILATREVSLDIDDPLLAIRMETIIRDAEFRTGVSEGIEFFNTRSNQMDTFLKIFEGEKVAIELTTAGGKTFVGSVLLKAQVELLGYKTGSYISKPGQEVDIQQAMMKAYGLGEDDVVILDSTRLSDESYVKMLQAAKFVVADPSNIQFIRNSANNFKDPNFKVANEVYTKLTQDTALYIDELQINLDPSRQAINPVGENSKDIPDAQKTAAEWVGDVLKDTLLDKGGWGLGEHGFLTVKTENGAEIAKFSKSAQEVIFDGLAQRSVAELEISREAYDAVKNNASELDKASYSPDFLKQELSKLGIDISADNAVKILDQIDMVNTFAQGLKMKSGTDYQRMVDTVLRDNGGLDRAVTVPASGAVASEGQSYNAKLQAAMEYIGSKANNEPTPNFDGLKSSPDLSYKSTIADFLGDLKNSSVGAVTGALADGKGVAETALGLVTYRSTEAVEKILSISGSSTGERISVDRSYGIHRDDDVMGVISLKLKGLLDKSAGLISNGNLKIVMGFDGAKNPLDFAIEMVRDKSGAFANSKFAVQKADGSYSLVKIDDTGKVVSSESITTKGIQDLYKNGETNLVTIIGRGGATGDSIATSKNIPGITVTSDSAPEGLVAQSGARIDRISGEVAEQYALIISRRVEKVAGIDAEGFLKISQMTKGDFQDFRNNVEKVQLAVEQAKNTVGLDQGVLASSTRVLSDLIRNSKDPKIQEWASARLLEFSSSETTRDLDLNGGDQETLAARQKKIAAQVEAWNKLFTNKDNAAILKKIKRSNSSLYKEMLGNSAVDSQKLSYAESESTSKEAVMTARNLSEFVERHNKYVVAGSESSYVASSGQKPVAQQIATAHQKNSIDGGKAGGEINRVVEDVKKLRNFGLGAANPLTFVGKVWSDRGQFVSSVVTLVKKSPKFVNNVRIVQRDEIRIYRGFSQDIEEREQELLELDEKIVSLDGDEKREATERKAKVLVEIESRKEYLGENVGNMARATVFVADIPAATVRIAKNQFSSLSKKQKDGKSVLSSLGNISEKVIPGFAKTGVWIADLSKKTPGFNKLKTQWVVIKDESAKKIAERREASDKEGTSDPLIRIISIAQITSGKVKEWFVTDPAVIEKRNEVIAELKIEEAGEFAARVEKIKTVEALDEFVAERRVIYQKLVKKLTSLGTNPQEALAGKNGNEERYQNELDRVEEIERLQKYSGLLFAAMNSETGHFAEQADGSIFRLGELEYPTLLAYREAAEKEISQLDIAKLAEKNVEEDGLEKSEEDTVATEVDYLRGFGVSVSKIGGFFSAGFQLGKNKLGTLLLDKSIPGSARVIVLANNIRANVPDVGALKTKWISVRDGASNKIAEGKESTGYIRIIETTKWFKTTSATVKSLFVEDAGIAKRKRDILIELKIKDEELKKELNRIQTVDGLDEFIAGRRKVYQGIVKKLTSLGTKPQKSLAGENGNEERYQNELQRIEEIEQLQRDSLLVFAKMDEDTGHFLEQEDGVFKRLGEYKDLPLGEYIKLAEKRINELEAVKIVEAEEKERVKEEESIDKETKNYSSTREIMARIFNEGNQFNRDIVYESLMTELSMEDIKGKISDDYIIGDISERMMDEVEAVAGEEYLRLLIDPSIGVRTDKLVSFINQEIVKGELPSPLDLRRKFRDSFSKRKVYRVAALTDDELENVKSNGFIANVYRNKTLKKDSFSDIGELQADVNIHANWVLVENSRLISTSDYPEMAKYAGFVGLKDNWEQRKLEGQKLYIFPIEVSEFDIIQYGDYLVSLVEGEEDSLWHSDEIDIPYNDSGLETWIESRISPESILVDEIEEVDVSTIPEFEYLSVSDLEGKQKSIFEKQAYELADAKTAAIGIGGLSAEENENLLDEINDAENSEAVNLIVSQRKEVDYKNLQNQFSSLGTSVKAINNETDYKNELDRLSKIIIEIEDLQNKSGLSFVNVDGDKKVPTTENGLYEIARVDDEKVLSKFTTEANREIEKLAGKDSLYLRASAALKSLNEVIPTSIVLSKLNDRLREINILRDSLDENHEWTALREGTSSENPLTVLVALSGEFSTAVELHDAVNLGIYSESDLKYLSIEGLEKQIEEKEKELLAEEKIATVEDSKDKEFEYQEVSSVNDINALLKTKFDDIDSIIEDEELQNNFKNLIQESREEQGKLFIITIGNKFWPVVASSIEEINDSRDKIIEISKFQDAIDEPLDLNGMCFYAHAAASVSGISDGVLQTEGSIHSHEKSLYSAGNHAIGYSDVKDRDRTIYFDLTAKIYTFIHKNKKGKYSYPMEGLIVIDKIGETKLVESLYKANWEREVFDLETILRMKKNINIFLSEEFSPEKYNVSLGQLEENKQRISKDKIEVRKEVYRQLEQDFLKLGVEKKIINEVDFTESLEELEIIIDQILIKEETGSKKFFVDGASKKFDGDNIFVGYSFEVLDEDGYFEFLEVSESDFNKQLSGIEKIQEFTFELEKLVEKRSMLFLPLEHLQSNLEDINRIVESLDLNLFADRSLKDRLSLIAKTFSSEEQDYRTNLVEVKRLIKEFNLRGVKVASTLDGLRKQKEILENFVNEDIFLKFVSSTKEVESFEVTRLYDNDGKRVDKGYLLNQSNVRSFLVDSFLDGSLYDSQTEDTFSEKISQAHEISNRGDVYQRVGEGSLGVDAGNFRSDRGRMRNGRQEQAMAVAKIAEKYGDPYALRFNKKQVSSSEVSLEGIPQEYLPEDVYDDDARTYTFYYPPSKAIPVYMQQINRIGIQISESFKNQNSSYEDLIKLIARQYQYGAIIRPFSQINNSLFMNLANAQLKLLGLSGISHYNLDLAAQRMQQDEFVEYFLDTVQEHNKKFVFSSKISKERSNLSVFLNNISDVEKVTDSLTTKVVELLAFNRQISHSDSMNVFFTKENSSVIKKFPDLEEKDIFINDKSFKESGSPNLVAGDLVTIKKQGFTNLTTTYLVSSLDGQVILVDIHLMNKGEIFVPAQTVNNFFKVDDNVTLIIKEGLLIGITDNTNPTRIEVDGKTTKTGAPRRLHPGSLVSINRRESDLVELVVEINQLGKFVLGSASESNSSQVNFPTSCSSCSEVRDKTASGMQQVDLHISDSREKLKQAQSLIEKIVSEENPDKVKQLKADARKLEQDAENLRKLALAQIDKTRKEVVDEHSMQNKCVQFYLRTLVDVREAEIRNNAVYISKASTSLDKAQHIAEELLAKGTMEIVTKAGFFGFGRESYTIDLKDQDKKDIRIILDNSDENVPGLKQLSETLSKLKEQPRSGSLFSNAISNISGQFRIWRESISTRLRWFSGSSREVSSKELADLRPFTKKVIDKYSEYLKVEIDSDENISKSSIEAKKDKINRVRSFFSKEETVKKIISIYTDLTDGKEIDANKQANIEANLEFILKRAFDQHLDNPEQYVSHGFDHTLNVTSYIDKIVETNPNIIHKVSEKYGISDKEAQFLLRTVGFFHDFGYPVSEESGLGKASHGLSGADIITYGKVISNNKEISLSENILTLLNAKNDKKEELIFDLRDSILFHSADKVEQSYGLKLKTSRGDFLLDNDNFLRVYNTFSNQGDITTTVENIYVYAETEAEGKKIVKDLLNGLETNQIYRKEDIEEISKTIVIVEKKFEGRKVDLVDKKDSLLGLEFSEVVLTKSPLQAIIRLADNMDMQTNRFSEIQNQPLFKAFYRALGDENSEFFERNADIESANNADELEKLIIYHENQITKEDIDSINLRLEVLRKGSTSDKNWSNLLDGYWKELIFNQILNSHDVSSLTDQQIEEVKKIALLQNSQSYRHFGGCEPIKDILIDSKGVHIKFDTDIFNELNKTKVEEKVVDNLTGEKIIVKIGIGEYQIWRMLAAYASIRFNEGDQNIPIYVNDELYSGPGHNLSVDLEDDTFKFDEESVLVVNIDKTRFKAVARFVQQTLKVIPSNLSLHELKNVLGKVNRLIEKNSTDDYLLIIDSKKISVVFDRLRSLVNSLVVTGNSNNDSENSLPVSEKDERNSEIGNMGPGRGLKNLLINLPLLLSGEGRVSGEASSSAEEEFAK